MINLIERYYSEFKSKLASRETSGLCLDLDDTLADTNVHWAQHFIEELGNPEGLSAKEIIMKYRYVKEVPYWNQSITDQWITQDHNSNNAKLQLPIIEGAPSWIEKIQKEIPILAYLTGRPENTITGTAEWLITNKFPTIPILAQPDEEILKEMKAKDGNEWKAKVLEYLYPEVEGTIDDNLMLGKNISQDYKGRIYLFSHNSESITSKNVICCPDWKDIFNEIKITRKS